MGAVMEVVAARQFRHNAAESAAEKIRDEVKRTELFEIWLYRENILVFIEQWVSFACGVQLFSVIPHIKPHRWRRLTSNFPIACSHY